MRARIAVGVGLLALASCHATVTEVVVVVDTDLSTPAEADTLQLQVAGTRSGTDQVLMVARDLSGAIISRGTLPTFPATLGLVPKDGDLTPFSVTATLLSTNATTRQQEIVATRKATDVQFVRGQTRALVLTLLRACACRGTNCPNPTGPPCADLAAPTLTPFDPNDIPHVAHTDGGAASSDGSPDAARDVAADATTRGDAARDGSIEAEADVARDVASDRPPDVGPGDVAPEGPARFALGHVCTTPTQCQGNFCVDGVCCESQCGCGTCGTTGTCAPAGAGTDPRGACGLYTCDGQGACTTSCPQEYGSCASACAVGGVCDGNGHCVATIARLNFCVVGTCTCQQGLSCQPQDGGGPGVCL